MQCVEDSTTTGHNNANKQVYFLSDSNDLVRHVTKELPVNDSNSNRYNWTLPQLQQLVASSTTKNNNKSNRGLVVVARDVTEETAHLDRQKGRSAPAYYDTFVDLLIVMHARCVVYGIGYYAAFGAKISGTPCRYLYQEEEWGSQAAKDAKLCKEQ